MIIVLSGRQRLEQSEYFERLFRLRHDIFIKRRGWALPSINGCEIDQYDDEDAVYFLEVDDRDDIRGTIRITPSVKSSLLADCFPHLNETRTTLRAPDIYECTRYIALSALKTRQENRAAKSRIISAMLEWSLQHKLRFLQTVIETSTLAAYLELTSQTVPLGLSHPYGGGRRAPGGGDCMAIRWPVTLQVLEEVRTYGEPEAPFWVPGDADRAGRDLPVALH
jgi:acyl-homoserine lactone synthase